MSFFVPDVLSTAFAPLLPEFAYVGPGAGFAFLGSFATLLAAFLLLLVSLLTWPIRLVIQAIRQWGKRTKGAAKRVVVVGLDGLDPQRVRRLLEAGRLPHFRKLQEAGTFVDLGTTLPPISPVAWSSFTTGVNPGKHNIFDFLNRDLRTYLPELSSAKVSQASGRSWLSWIGMSGAEIRLLRKSQPFWRLLGDHGVFSTILRVPITFPPEKFNGLSLSAMCTPDIRGTQGTFTYFTTSAEECKAATGGEYVKLESKGNRLEGKLPGPPNPSGKQPADLHVAFTIEIDKSGKRGTLQIGDRKVSLEPGKYSPWVRVTFKAGRFTKVYGVCRFRFDSLAPEVRLYASPVQIDPERPALPISHPLYYSIYLAKLHDTYATLGLAEDTWALNSGAMSEQAFLDQAYSIHDEREKMFFDALRRTRRGLCACVFDASDRIQHMFSRYDKADHPANAGKEPALHAKAIDEMYVRMDALVGKVHAAIDDDTVLMVISDHGFCDFSRGVNLNAWLLEQGYLAMKAGAQPGDYLAGVDWTKTRAYAFGLSGIYLNQVGREAHGIVKPGSDATALKAEIAARLRTLVDGAQKTIIDVYDSHQVYRGPYVDNGPDLLVGYERGYRASWETVVGGTKGEILTDNTKYWSGDHCVDPSAVPGIFFCNRTLQDASPSITDMAPTILKLFGVPVPPYMDGKALGLAPLAKAAAT